MSMQFVDRTPPEGGANAAMLAVTDDSIRLTPVRIPDDRAMVFSVWCQASAEATIQIIGGGTQESVEVGTEWTRAVVEMAGAENVVITVPTGKTVYFYKAQLEAGTRVSDWKPAQEDTDAEIAGIQIGGVNLFTGTQYFEGGSWQDWSYRDWTVSAESHDGMTVMQRTGAWSGLTQPIQAVTGETFTLSAYVKPGTGADVRFYCENANRNGTPISDLDADTWKRIQMTFTMQATGTMTPRFENSVDDAALSICGLKLERGNRATDWSPAPEDVAGGIEDARSAAYMARDEFRRVVRIDNDGLHVGDNLSGGEVLIDSESMNVVLYGVRFSKFASNYVQFGNYQLRRSADGGLAFKLKEA